MTATMQHQHSQQNQPYFLKATPHIVPPNGTSSTSNGRDIRKYKKQNNPNNNYINDSDEGGQVNHQSSATGTAYNPLIENRKNSSITN
jgi:hypothetical protein